LRINKEDIRKNSLLYFLSFGHGSKHIFSSSVQVLIPFIKESLSLSGVQIGALASTNSIAAGLINVPAGLLTDLYKKRVGLIISSSAFMLFLGFILVSFLSESNWVVLGFLSFIVLGAGANLWHPPAFPAEAADKCTPKAYAFFPGYFELKTANAGGCQRFAPAPKTIKDKNPNTTQLDSERKETKMKPKNNINALEEMIKPTLFLYKSVNSPAGTLIKPAAILFVEAKAPI
jgi:hypothetical protein